MEVVDLEAAKEFSPTHVLEGEGLFTEGRTEKRLGPGDTVLFAAGEAHQVRALTRMVLYRVQAGADRVPEMLDGWPDELAKK